MNISINPAHELCAPLMNSLGVNKRARRWRKKVEQYHSMTYWPSIQTIDATDGWCAIRTWLRDSSIPEHYAERYGDSPGIVTLEKVGRGLRGVIEPMPDGVPHVPCSAMDGVYKVGEDHQSFDLPSGGYMGAVHAIITRQLPSDSFLSYELLESVIGQKLPSRIMTTTHTSEATKVWINPTRVSNVVLECPTSLAAIMPHRGVTR